MNLKTTLLAASLLALTGCAGLTPPPADKLAALPVVTYPDTPPAGDYIYRLPAGKPINLRLLVDGNALDNAVEQNLNASLKRDLYLYKRWASDDGKHWRDARQAVGVNLTLSLPSYDAPKPGEMHLTIERKDAP